LQGTLMAVKAGVDIIEHGQLLDEKCAAEMAKRSTWYVPTFTIYRWHAENNPNLEVRKKAKLRIENHVHSFNLALKAGVPIAMGTDAGFAAGVVGIELKYMVDAGMTPMQAIEASTRHSSACMRMQDQVGTLEQGKEADLLVVNGDPLQDISLLAQPVNISLVMKGGKPLAGPLLYQFPWQPTAPNKNWL
jgi:imidazolonepropionase-like amidohydrolase